MIAEYVVHFKGVIAIGEERRIQVQLPGLHRLVRHRVEAEVPALAGLPVLHHCRALHHHLRAWGGFVADHGIGAGSAARRKDALAVDALGNNDALARLQHLGRRVNRAEGALLAARPFVIGVLRLPIHVIGLREVKRLLPDGKLRSVRKHRVRRKRCPSREQQYGETKKPRFSSCNLPSFPSRLKERLSAQVLSRVHSVTLFYCLSRERPANEWPALQPLSFAGKLEEGWRVSGTQRALMAESSENAERWQSPVECT